MAGEEIKKCIETSCTLVVNVVEMGKWKISIWKMNSKLKFSEV